MKQLGFLYFNVYNHYSKRSYYPGDLSVRFQTMYLLSLCAGGWILFLQASILRIVRHSWYSSQGTAMLFAMTIYLGIGLLFHRIFIVNEKDQKIVDKYAQAWDRNPNKKRDLFISAFIAIAPYMLLASLKVFFPHN